MALYEELRKIDVISPVAQDLEQMGYKLCYDGKIRNSGAWGFNTGGPWINLKVGQVRNCARWQIYRQRYNLISRNCFHCWKIVVKPKTLTELFDLYEFMRKYVLDEDAMSCKCGIEKRPYRSHTGLYAGFFYTSLLGGKEGAKKQHADIKAKLQKSIRSDLSVILKRACTEMEDEHGPSNLWEYPHEQDMLEDLLDAT